MMSTTATRAVVGDLSIRMVDGTVLRSHTDVGLAEQWAEYVHGNVWERLSHGQQCEATAEATGSGARPRPRPWPS